MPDIAEVKAQLRETLRQRRRGLSERQQLSAALALPTVINSLPCWANARYVALYLAADGEIDTTALVESALERGKTVFLPRIQPDDSLGFSHWRPDAVLASNRYGIPEPGDDAATRAAAELDVVFLPLVGWDRGGGRLGMGGGFYDRSLADISGPVLVGLAHGLQEVDRVPREKWDIALDYVATEQALHDCSQAAPGQVNR